MKIIRINANVPFEKASISIGCIGYFDGLHLGHLALLEKGKEYALKQQVKRSCICFDNDPWIVMNKSEDLSQITPFSLRMKKMEEQGIDICYILHFDETMRTLTANAFIEGILKKCNLQMLICGEDFKFGYQGEGTTKVIRKAGIPLHVIEEVRYHGKKISSSTIEQLLKEGKVEEANLQLGYVYTISGKVIHGNQKGRSVLHFPTANVALEDSYVIVKNGVYEAVVKYHDKIYQALVNIGHNPTMNYRQDVSIEAHLFDFDEQIYGEEICVSFIRYLREEKKFNRVEALIAQLQQDVYEIQKDKGR